MRSQRTIQSWAAARSTLGCEDCAGRVAAQLPDDGRPCHLRRAETRRVRLDVVDDARARLGCDAVRVLVEREPQWKYCPPSMTIVCPVTNADVGPAR